MERKGDSLGTETERLREQLKQLKEKGAETERKVAVAQEEMRKQGAVGAETGMRLRTWPGVDWTLPAWSVWLMQDADTPAQGKVAITEKGVTHELKFDGGWTVTNDLEAAKRIVRNLKQQYAIAEVQR